LLKTAYEEQIQGERDYATMGLDFIQSKGGEERKKLKLQNYSYGSFKTMILG